MPDKIPPRPSRRARHPFIIVGSLFFTFLLFAAIVGGTGFWMGTRLFEAPGPLADDKTVVIPEQTGLMDIADQLARQGVIEDKWAFVGGALINRATGKLKAGEYRFAKGASAQQVLATIVSGKVVEYGITIPEGLTSEQIVAKLGEYDVLAGEVRQVPREGTLLPETYKVTRGTSREDVLKRMAREQQRVVQDLWAKRAPSLPLKTPEEMVVLASIVEKETGRPDERSLVASVFVNRLNRKMKLQSDPTIIYGLVRGKGKLDRPLSRADITSPTAYNTYTIDGLPPGPIANPGKDSLEAVAHPAQTKSVFFVADGTGGHAFADTLDQHNKNVARWRQLEQSQGNAVPDTSVPPAAAPAKPGVTN